MQRTLLILLSFYAAAPAQSPKAGDLKAWSKAQRSIDREERRFWKDFTGRGNQAILDFGQPIREARQSPDTNKEAVYDYDPIDTLVEAADSLGQRRGDLDGMLDATDPKSADALLKALLQVAKQMDKIEPELLSGKPNFSRYVFDQEPGCRILALETRRNALVAALSGADMKFLVGTAWKAAARSDGKRSVRRRMAVLDACVTEALAPFLAERLQEKTAGVRIAAIESLVRINNKSHAALTGVLRKDKSGAVRRSLLLGLLALKTCPGEWFEAVLKHARSAQGYERALAIRVLTHISNQHFGHDLTAWKKWYAIYAKELKGGKFDLKTVEVTEAKPAPDSDSFSFYGLRVSSTGAVFVIEGSQHIAMPADVDVQRTRWRDLWRPTRHSWEDDHETHGTALTREFTGAHADFPEGFRWAMVMLHGAFVTQAIGEKRLLNPTVPALNDATKLIERAPGRGWCSPYEGMRTAATIGGDAIDSIVFWGTGDPAGGRFIGAPNAIRAWNRLNRTRKLQVIAVRISNRKTPAEKFLKSIATQYVWAKKPPS